MHEDTLEANGLAHHVLRWGDGDAAHTIVMCHGFLDLGWGFSRLAERLAREGYRVFAFDFRGHGESEWVGRGGYYHFVDYVLDVHALFPQLCEGPVHLLGHSMGGTVATLYAGSHPDRVRSLTLLEGYGPPVMSLHPVERMLAWIADVEAVREKREPVRLDDLDAAYARLRARNTDVPEDFLRGLAARSTKPHPSGAGLTWRFDPLHRSRSPIGFDPERFAQFAARIDAPTLLMQGEQGMRVGDDDARMQRYPNARRASVARAGHMLHWSHTDEVAAHLLAFLRSL